MTRYLLDSDSVIQFFNGSSEAIQLVSELDRQGDVLCTCGVVLTEVYSGLRPEHVPQGDTFLQSMQFLSSAPEIGRRAGIWRYEYARQGMPLSAPDCLVAATAYHHRATLVTGNTRLFPMKHLATLRLPQGS